MTWEEFLEAVDALHLDDVPPVLLLAGVAFDNALRDQLAADKRAPKAVPNNAEILSNSAYHGCDFVWNAGWGVRISVLMTGGHPALAGTSTIHCAGRIEDFGLFFHSGHYPPKRTEALFFVADMIRNSCAGLEGRARDAIVDRIANTRLRLYHDASEIATYDTTFEAEFGATRRREAPVAASSSRAIPIPRSAPVGIGSSMPMAISRPIAIGRAIPEFDPAPVATISTAAPPPPDSLGISRTGRAFVATRVDHGRARWVPDEDVTKCQSCRKNFTFTRRRHHCRQCGNVFCDACSSRRKRIRFPAGMSNETAHPNDVRVCDDCYLRDDPTR